MATEPPIFAASEKPSIALGLGSNVGPAHQIFDSACGALELRGVRILDRSPLFLTRPWGVEGAEAQADFTNAALLVETKQSPRELLSTCLDVEKSLGRLRLRRYGPREIDIDILFYGAERLNEPGLIVPHPMLVRRDFVLEPLRQLGVRPPAGSLLPEWWEALEAIAPDQLTIISSQEW